MSIGMKYAELIMLTMMAIGKFCEMEQLENKVVVRLLKKNKAEHYHQMARCDLVMIVYVPDSLGLDKTVDLGVFG